MLKFESLKWLVTDLQNLTYTSGLVLIRDDE